MNSNPLPNKESDTVEFKTAFDIELTETLCAFANSRGGAVYPGVDDKGRVSGIEAGAESANRWLNQIKTSTAPSLLPEIEIVRANDKNVAVFAMPEYPIKPVACKGRYFKRIGNSNHQMSASEVADMRLIEKYGSGIGRIVTAFESAGAPAPLLEEIGDGFKVTVFPIGNVPLKKTPPITPPIGNVPARGLTEKILGLLLRNNKMSAASIAKQLRISRDTVKEYLDKLKVQRRIQRVGSARSGYWKVKNGKGTRSDENLS